jgi:hypothetical protein
MGAAEHYAANVAHETIDIIWPSSGDFLYSRIATYYRHVVRSTFRSFGQVCETNIDHVAAS